MDEIVLLTKIESLERCLKRIKSRRPDSLEILESDLDRQDIIVLNLERAVQICVDIASLVIAEIDAPTPTKMSGSFSVLAQKGILKNETSERMQKAVGFRNIAVHEYSSLNWEIVYSIINKHLDDFKQFASEIVYWHSNQ